MSKNKTTYVCSECGATFHKWQGQCTTCKEWSTIAEVDLSAQKHEMLSQKLAREGSYSGSRAKTATTPSKIKTTNIERYKTGVSEFDRVMGGGITNGSATLISGSPGAGKTTLLTLLSAIISSDNVILYATGEENDEQWLQRQKRVAPNYNDSNLFLLATDVLDDVFAEAARINAKFIIYDSIQSFVVNSCEGARGSISQVKECGSEITKFAKTTNRTSIIVGQVTKDNTMAGPKVLEHTIDTHIHLDKSEYSNLRTLRAYKNRFGNEDAVGLFKMEGDGMVEINDPSAEFRSGNDEPASGCAITCLRSDNRNILMEIQALVVETQSEKLQRVCLGVSYNRLQLITAILRKHCHERFFADIFITIVGGFKISEQDTSSDLAMAAALMSSNNDKIIPDTTCFIGELTLTGDIKSVPNAESRVEEAARLGFEKIVVGRQLFGQIKSEKLKKTLKVINNIRELQNEL